MKNIVIIGASAAGHTLATLLREGSKDCAITLLSEESVPCYDKRRLPELLSGKVKEKEIFISSDDFYRKQNIVFIKECKVSSVNTQKNLVYGKNIDALPYDFLIICTGRRFVVPSIAGAKKTGVFCLNSLSDFRDILSYGLGDSVCVVGSGNWAQEAAKGLALTHKETRLIFDQTACADDVQPFLEGVEVIRDEPVEIIGESQVQAVKLKKGKIIAASAVFYAGGLKSNIDFLKNADIGLNGDLISVNDQMQTTRENVFACGAVCSLNQQHNVSQSWDEVVAQSSLLAHQLLSALDSSAREPLDFS